MRVSIALAATCVTTSAVLLLSACGGSGSKDSDKIQSDKSASPSAASPSVSPSATASASAGRPTITFPSYAKDVFEGQHTGDATKDAILSDSAQSVRSVDEAIFQGTTHTKALEFYNIGKGYENSIIYVSGVLKKGYTWTGTVRFFDRKVTILAPGQASVIYCSDESKEFPKHRKTGKIDNVPTTSQSYVLYNTDLKKNAQGVWQTDNVSSFRGSKQCQP
jgi:hypothetical protein